MNHPQTTIGENSFYTCFQASWPSKSKIMNDYDIIPGSEEAGDLLYLDLPNM